MAITTIPIFTGDSPDRNQQSAAAFTINSIEWLDYQLVQIDATNVTVEGINLAVISIDANTIAAAASADSANSSDISSQSNANFKGRWSDATGAATIPATYSNNSQTWQLLQDIPDITADEPLPGASNWQVVNDINMSNVNVSELDNPLFHGFKKNKFVETSKGNVSSTRNTVATRVDINKVVRDVGIDDPREEETGWLFEGSNENILTPDTEDAAWGTLRTSKSNDGTLAPNGVGLATKLTEDSTASVTHTIQKLTVPLGTFAGEKVSKTIDAKAGVGGRNVALETDGFSNWVVDGTAVFDLTNGVVLSVPAGLTATIKPLVNGWFRCYLHGELEVGASDSSQEIHMADGVDKSYNGDGASFIYVANANLVEGHLTDSFIDKIGTRSADDQSFPSAENFRESEGAIFLKADVIGDTGVEQFILDITDATAQNRIQVKRLTTDKLQALFTTDGSTVASLISSDDFDIGTSIEIGINYGLNKFELFIDGVLEASDVAGTPPSGMETVHVGSRRTPGAELFGHIQDLRFYPKQLNIDEFKYLGGL